MEDTAFNEAMGLIVSALKERGYDPYSQIFGYLKESKPEYITSHNSARELIQRLDKEKIATYINTYLKQNL